MLDTYVTKRGRSIISTLNLASSGNAKSLQLASICGIAYSALSRTDRGCCFLGNRVYLVSVSVSACQRTLLRATADSYGYEMVWRDTCQVDGLSHETLALEAPQSGK